MAMTQQRRKPTVKPRDASTPHGSTAAESVRHRRLDRHRRSVFGNRADAHRRACDPVENALVAGDIEVRRLRVVETERQQRPGKVQRVSFGVCV